MSHVISFQQALAKASDPDKRILLLGNGFSTALFSDVFSYRSLFEEANFNDKPALKSVFEQLGTSDFEKVIRALEHGHLVINKYEGPATLADQVKIDAAALKNILLQTIAGRHPDTTAQIEEAAKRSCNLFLSHFKRIYTLNYDVILYWVLLHGRGNRPDDIDDGFRLPDGEFGANYRVFDSPHTPTFWFLHGGLHIFDSGSETRMYVWADSGKPIIAQVRAAIEQNLYPLFVAEGSSKQKMTKINHNGYLSKALRSFESYCDKRVYDIFLFGHSLNDTDEHILNKIKRGSTRRLFVSVYKGSATSYDSSFIAKARSLASSRNSRNPLEIILFDAESSKVWSNLT